MDEHIKSLNLGLRIVNITGPRLLEVALMSLGSTISRDAPAATGATGDAEALPDADSADV